jgi:amino acid adenylation domain-containing protein
MIAPLETEREVARYDLDCSMKEGDDGRLRCTLTYNTQLFQRTTIQNMLNRLQTLFEAVCKTPDLSFYDLPQLTEQEQQQITTWNTTSREDYGQTSLLEMFENTALEIPHAVAVIGAEQVLTYQVLNKYANHLAHRLRTLGVGPEVMVGVCMRRSPEMLISLLAILKAGGVYVPLDPAYPAVHLASILADCALSLLITDQESLLHIPPHGATTLCLDAEWAALARESDENIVQRGTPDNAMYVMFTSGSTGRPKGVVVPQRQVLNRFAWMWRTYPFTENEKVCQRTTASFTPSIWEMLGPLLRGVPVVIIQDAIVKDPLLLIQTLAAQRVTRIVVVPSLLDAILNTRLDLQHSLAHLKLWSVGGELLSSKLAQRFQELLPHATLINQYGATEMSDIVYCENSSSYLHCTSVPGGRPITNTRVYLLDRHWRLRSVGQPGELYVGGPGVPRGYLNRPDLTAERFIPDPFSTKPGARLYNMGDIAHYLPDGSIDLLGRRDHQVKIRGFRVEIAGIEAILRDHPQIQQAAVAIRPKERGGDDKQLIAYIVPMGDETLSLANVRDFMKNRVPEYMLPADFMLMDTLPSTPNGKLDRKALLELRSSLPVPDAAPTRPQTEMEHIIAEIWQDVLQIQNISVHSNFFDLGGHSLLSIEVRNKLQEILQREITLIELFEHPTINALARHLVPQQIEQPVLEQVQEQADVQRTSRKRRKQFRQMTEGLENSPE